MKTHGHASKGSSPTYRTWDSMKKRCSDPKNASWPRYGGRGIKVCERWLKFENFLTDMGVRPDGRSIDRIDNDGHYEPGNCRWATPKQQQLNTRLAKPITFGGETLSRRDWAARLGLTLQALSARVKRYGEQAAIELGPKTDQSKPYKHTTLSKRRLNAQNPLDLRNRKNHRWYKQNPPNRL